MLLDSGILFLCFLSNVASPGAMPCEKLVKIGKFWYGERTVGYNRLYTARGVDEEIDMLVRVAHTRAARAGMYAVLGNGEQYRITAVQQIVDTIKTGSSQRGNGLRYTDLTLRRLEENYNVEEANPDAGAGDNADPGAGNDTDTELSD